MDAGIPEPLRYLPTTRWGLAEALRTDVHNADGILYYWQRKGKAVKTERKMPNGTTGRGAKSSPIWERA